MKLSSSLLLAAVSALYVAGVHGHGQMVSPTPRAINTKYRSDALFGLKGAGDSELQLAPLENLSGRGQSDQPASPTFDIYNGCRGIEYEEGGVTTSVSAGATIPVKWEIQAPHPGYMEVYVVKKATDASGKVTYKQDGAALKRIDNFATGGGSGETTVTLPSSLSGCGTAGECALQMYWHSDVASQTYVTCADIVVGGSGSAPAPAPAPTTEEPDDEYPAPAPTTEAPANDATPAPAPVPAPSPSKACTRRMRRN